MADQGDHKKDDSGETVYSAISGSSEVPIDYFFLTSEEEYKPPRNFEDSGFDPVRRIFPIARDDPIVAIWNISLRFKVIKLIKSNTDWHALDVIRRGYGLRSEDNPVVILITVTKNAFVPEWRQFVYEIKRFCISERCPHVLVQVQEGNVFRGAFVSRPYDQRPLLGSSVGTIGDGDGTLGGYIELYKEGQQPIRVGVTCHHVVVSGSEDKSCISPGGDSTISVYQPSPRDYRENEEKAMLILKEHENEIGDIKSRAKEGLARNAELRWLPDKEAALAAEKALLSATQDFNTHLGYVFASSGFRRRRREPPEDGCCLDWGLIKIGQGRLGDNKFPEGVFPHFNRPIPPYITDTTSMDFGDEAVKWGRSTEYTTGTLNSIKSNCRLPDTDGLSTEWCFVGRNRGGFADLGDSGSFVVSRFGKLSGMVIGGSERGPCCSLAYVTPIKEVFDDIERQLGCSVHLPEV